MGYDFMSSFEKAWRLVKDMATATRTADLWSMNDETLYFKVRDIITKEVKFYYDSDETEEEVKENIIEELAARLPEMMANMPGFMDDLLSPVNIDDEMGDSISDVDWREVAENYSEDIDGIMDDFYFDRHGQAFTE
jgi:hypothetical protein